MKFTVIWTPRAERELTALWLDAADSRAAMAEAANAIDSKLAAAPLAHGESRSGAVRIMFQPPLVVEYEVFEDDRTVHVLMVWEYGKPQRS